MVGVRKDVDIVGCGPEASGEHVGSVVNLIRAELFDTDGVSDHDPDGVYPKRETVKLPGHAKLAGGGLDGGTLGLGRVGGVSLWRGGRGRVHP